MSKMYLKELLDLEIRKLRIAVRNLEKKSDKEKPKDLEVSYECTKCNWEGSSEPDGMKCPQCGSDVRKVGSANESDELLEQLQAARAELKEFTNKMSLFINNSQIKVDTPKNKKLMHLDFDLHIDDKQMELNEDGALIISGWCMKEGTWNGLFFPEDEIIKSAKGLKGKQLKINHSRDIQDIVGVVLDSDWDDKRKVMTFVARVERKDIIEMILAKRVKAVSVGVRVNELFDKELERYYATDLEYVELSVVDIPAVKGAGFNKIEKA